MDISEALERLNAIKLPDLAGKETWEHVKIMTPVTLVLSAIMEELEEEGLSGDIVSQIHTCHFGPTDHEAHTHNWDCLCDAELSKIAALRSHLEALQ